MSTRNLISEQDVQDAIRAKRSTIQVEGVPIITSLAASLINEHHIRVIQADADFYVIESGPCVCVGCPDEVLDISGYDKDFLLQCLTTMMKIRGFEEAMGILCREKHLPGALHLSIGQEAVTVGACSALREKDIITLTHRGHGGMIAKGADIKKMAAELLGKASGYCHGKGGSMHVADFQNGILGANGIVGAGIVIAVGAAMSAKVLKGDHVALTFFGDGSTNQGAFHEGMNYAAAQKLPVIFLCENNHYAISTSAKKACATDAIAKRGLSYDMPAVQLDGQNVLLVHDTVSQAAERARSGGGPTLIECITYRTRGHWEGETIDVRPEKEKAIWGKRDPIQRLKYALIAQSVTSQDQIDEISSRLVREIGEAVRFAEESPYPDADEVVKDVLEGSVSHA